MLLIVQLSCCLQLLPRCNFNLAMVTWKFSLIRKCWNNKYIKMKQKCNNIVWLNLSFKNLSQLRLLWFIIWHHCILSICRYLYFHKIIYLPLLSAKFSVNTSWIQNLNITIFREYLNLQLFNKMQIDLITYLFGNIYLVFSKTK